MNTKMHVLHFVRNSPEREQIYNRGGLVVGKWKPLPSGHNKWQNESTAATWHDIQPGSIGLRLDGGICLLDGHRRPHYQPVFST